jgi:hypothetical protein
MDYDLGLVCNRRMTSHTWKMSSQVMALIHSLLNATTRDFESRIDSSHSVATFFAVISLYLAQGAARGDVPSLDGSGWIWMLDYDGNGPLYSREYNQNGLLHTALCARFKHADRLPADALRVVQSTALLASVAADQHGLAEQLVWQLLKTALPAAAAHGFADETSEGCGPLAAVLAGLAAHINRHMSQFEHKSDRAIATNQTWGLGCILHPLHLLLARNERIFPAALTDALCHILSVKTPRQGLEHDQRRSLLNRMQDLCNSDHEVVWEQWETPCFKARAAAALTSEGDLTSPSRHVPASVAIESPVQPANNVDLHQSENLHGGNGALAQ